MGMKVASTCLQWSAHHPIITHCPPSLQNLASSKQGRRRGEASAGKSMAFQYAPPHRFNQSAFLGHQFSKLHRSRSCELREFSKTTTTTKTKSRNPLRRACSSSLNTFSDEEFSKQIHDLALKFRISDEEDNERKTTGNRSEPEIIHESTDNQMDNYRYSTVGLLQESSSGTDSLEPPWRETVNYSSILRKANSVDLPLSLRIIKRKLHWEDGFRGASESAYCSVKRAFSSMVFMIEELHSFTLQMRELLLCEDLQGILQRVQKEMHASFVWLFQRVFSQTPTLMMSVMILLANFTVHSMGTNNAIAAAIPPQPCKTEEVCSVVEIQGQTHQEFDSSSIKTFRISPDGSKTISLGSGHGGGGKVRHVASGAADGNGWFNEPNRFRTSIPDGVSWVSTFDSATRGEESVSSDQDEMRLWNAMVEEAERMQDPSVDQEIKRELLSPVDVRIEPDDYTDYFRTELLYQTGLVREPKNPLLLANYAQFLYLVAQDYDRAEECFKRAIGTKPVDPEALSKYANFLWRVRKDLWAAEETLLEAISVDPTNSHYAANYANFLWNTGGVETCFPLDSSEAPQGLA